MLKKNIQIKKYFPFDINKRISKYQECTHISFSYLNNVWSN